MLLLFIGAAGAETIWSVSSWRDNDWQDDALPGDIVEFSWPNSYESDWIGVGIRVSQEGLTFRGATPETPIPPLMIQGVTATIGPGTFVSSANSFGTGSAPYYAAVVAEDATITLDTVLFDGIEARGQAPTWPSVTVMLEDSSATLASVTFQGCTVDRDATPYIVVSENTSTDVALALHDVTFIGDGSAGGLFVEAFAAAADIEITGGSWRDLYATDGGGVHLDAGDGRLSVDGTVFEFNRAETAGGAIYAQNGVETTLHGVQCDFGSAYVGGCFYQYGGALEVVGLSARENSAAASGGVLYAYGAQTEVRHAAICANSSGSGGDLTAADGEFLLQYSLLQGARGTAALGLSAGVQPKIENVTFAANAQTAVDADGVEDFRMFNTLVEGSSKGLVLSGSSVNQLDYNLWFDNAETIVGAGTGAHSLSERPLYVDFDPSDCDSRPIPADFSPVIDAGDPSLEDPWGGRSDIGMFGGPGSVEIDPPEPPEPTDSDDSAPTPDSSVDSDPFESPGERWISGGCAPLGSTGAVLVLLGLGLVRRRS